MPARRRSRLLRPYACASCSSLPCAKRSDFARRATNFCAVCPTHLPAWRREISPCTSTDASSTTPTQSSCAKAPSTFAFLPRAVNEPESGVKTATPLVAIFFQAFRLLARRWFVFTVATIVALALQIAIAIVWRIPHGAELGNDVAVPILVALIYAFIWGDAREEPLSNAAIWERFLERTWAVIIIDYCWSQLASLALAFSLAPDFLYVLIGMIATVLATLLVFADASATTDDDVTTWIVPLQGFVRSAVAAWKAAIFPRALAIYAIEILLFAASQALAQALHAQHIADADFWGQALIGTLTAPPLAALIVLVYRDASKQASQASSE